MHKEATGAYWDYYYYTPVGKAEEDAGGGMLHCLDLENSSL